MWNKNLDDIADVLIIAYFKLLDNTIFMFILIVKHMI